VKEVTYGAAPGREFEPVIPGVEVPPPVIKPQTPDYDYEYYDNYVQTEAPVRQERPSRRRPSRVKVNRRLRPQPAKEQTAVPADVPRVASKTRPQISAPGDAPAPAARPQFVAAKAQPAPQEFIPQAAPQQQPARQAQPLSSQDFSYNIPGSHSVSISLPSFFPAAQQPFRPQAPIQVNRAPAQGSPVVLPPAAAPVHIPQVHAPRQHIPVLTAQQVHPSLSKLDLNTGSYSLTVGGRR